MTLTLLVILVAFPLSFIALQAVFPINAGDFSGALWRSHAAG
jgi:iron(III) transport system permease protein